MSRIDSLGKKKLTERRERIWPLLPLSRFRHFFWRFPRSFLDIMLPVLLICTLLIIPGSSSGVDPYDPNQKPPEDCEEEAEAVNEAYAALQSAIEHYNNLMQALKAAKEELKTAKDELITAKTQEVEARIEYLKIQLEREKLTNEILNAIAARDRAYIRLAACIAKVIAEEFGYGIPIPGIGFLIDKFCSGAQQAADAAQSHLWSLNKRWDISIDIFIEKRYKWNNAKENLNKAEIVVVGIEGKISGIGGLLPNIIAEKASAEVAYDAAQVALRECLSSLE